MDFPAHVPQPCDPPPTLLKAFASEPIEILKASDYLMVFPKTIDLTAFTPDMGLLSKLDLRGVMITAQHEHYDFISRFFAPKYGIPEDPVTGSAHCALVPYWSQKLNKPHLHACQVSPRRGELFCEDQGDRVMIGGEASLFLKGSIFI
jgi:predicted PhzF superfamily epimerase YddE/YHI9